MLLISLQIYLTQTNYLLTFKNERNIGTYHLPIDIGASSGRHILGYIEDEKLVLEEVHRFENYIKNENGTLVWDIQHLVNEVIRGIAMCMKIGKIPSTVAIDTWGVDLWFT